MADERTHFEKLIDGVHELSKVLIKYHDELVNNGFGSQEALEMTLQYQHELFETIRMLGGRNNAPES